MAALTHTHTHTHTLWYNEPERSRQSRERCNYHARANHTFTADCQKSSQTDKNNDTERSNLPATSLPIHDLSTEAQTYTHSHQHTADVEVCVSYSWIPPDTSPSRLRHTSRADQQVRCVSAPSSSGSLKPSGTNMMDFYFWCI